MMSVITLAKHTKQALGMLVSQFRNKSRIAAILSAVMRQVAELDRVFNDIRPIRNLEVDNTSGAGLDLIGRVLNLARAGWTDAQYRLFLKVQVAANRSSGKSDEILSMFRILYPLADLAIYSFNNASFILSVLGVVGVSADAEVLLLFLTRAKTAGVKPYFEYSESPASEVFTWASTTPVASSTTGWGDTALTTGGVWTAIIS